MNNIQDWQHEMNQKEAAKLRAEGYTLEVSSSGYSVSFGGTFLGGASVGQRTSVVRRTLKHKLADIRDHLYSAITIARSHKSKMEKAVDKTALV